MISTIAVNLLKVVRTLGEAVGYTIIAGVALIFAVEHEPSVIEAIGMLALFCMIIIGAQIALFIRAKERQKASDRADTKARAPLPEKAATDARPAPTTRPQVSPWNTAA